MNLNLDLVKGQTVVMNGYSCIVRAYTDGEALLEYPNSESRWESFEDIADENEDLVIEEDYDIIDSDYDDDGYDEEDY